MRKHRFDLAVLASLATVVLATLIATEPAWRDRSLHIFVLVLAGLLLIGFVSDTGADTGAERPQSPFAAALSAPGRPESELTDLARVQREVTLATATAYDLHFRLVPALREVAWGRLERAGREPGPDSLGPWWELLRPDRVPTADRFAPGISARDLRALVDYLAMI
jgi:hypothetical protein